jgi:DNA-directed RNA polymerase beta subunit
VVYHLPGLKATLRLIANDKDNEDFETIAEVFLGTSRHDREGSFVINGALSVAIVSQLHCLAGRILRPEQAQNGTQAVFARIISFKGSWNSPMT